MQDRGKIDCCVHQKERERKLFFLLSLSLSFSFLQPRGVTD